MRTLPLLVSMLCASVAFAEPPASSPSAVTELVDKQLLAPLKKAESRRSRFSRAAPVAVERRLRLLDAVALTDRHGKAFFRFAIDERRAFDEAGQWEKDRISGCAYPGERTVFVQHGAAYVPARNRLGGAEKADPYACRAAPGLARGPEGALRQQGAQLANSEPVAPTPARIP